MNLERNEIERAKYDTKHHGEYVDISTAYVGDDAMIEMVSPERIFVLAECRLVPVMLKRQNIKK